MTSLRRLGRVLPALVLLGACDIPSAAPKWDTKWNVPGKSTSIPVSNLLPAGVTITPDSAAFVVNVDSVYFAHSLGQDCNSCAVFNGYSIPKPAFSVHSSDTTAIVSQLQSAGVSGDTLVIRINNGFSFDLLKPSASASQPTGQMYLTVTNGVNTIATDTIDGATQGIPAGQVTTVKMPLNGSITGTAPMVVDFLVNSPAGDSAVMNSAAQVSISAKIKSAAVNRFRVNAPVVVRVTSQSITADPTNIDLSNMDSSTIDHIVSGALLLTISNPFGIQGTASATFTNTALGTITKSFTLSASPNAPEVRIDFSQAELRALMNRNVTLNFGGTVCASTCNVSVSPKQVVGVTARLEMTLSSDKTP